jgi:pilus assembly protein CpaB
VLRRLLIAATALILAGIGVGSVLAYVRSADTRALAGMKAVSVLVARKSIPAGTAAGIALRQGWLASERMPASAVPAEAVGAITAELAPLVLSDALPAGGLLLRPTLVTAAQLTSGLAIPPGLIAVTAQFCIPEAVAGAVGPSSEVAVFDTVVSAGTGQVTSQPACTGPHQQGSGGGRTRVVLSRVLVLSVGAAAATTGSATSPALGQNGSSGQGSELVTVAVSQAQAEKLIQVLETGLPYLALLSPSSRTKADIGHLLQPPRSPSATPTTPRPTLTGPSSVIIVQPSGAPIPVVIATPTPAPAPSGKRSS